MGAHEPSFLPIIWPDRIVPPKRVDRSDGWIDPRNLKVKARGKDEEFSTAVIRLQVPEAFRLGGTGLLPM